MFPASFPRRPVSAQLLLPSLRRAHRPPDCPGWGASIIRGIERGALVKVDPFRALPKDSRFLFFFLNPGKTQQKLILLPSLRILLARAWQLESLQRLFRERGVIHVGLMASQEVLINKPPKPFKGTLWRDCEPFPLPSTVVHVHIGQNLTRDNRQAEKRRWSLGERETGASGRRPGRWYLNPALQAAQGIASRENSLGGEWTVDSVYRPVRELGWQNSSGS